ncbi:hypothetical protein NDU88_000413 [Pleurodeles waltl]|uniref:Uncharacterized protein n=1 Tax=Pleurodeles waltl TaxID=8319 RepID=A0AAV7TF30_PLEWA|nr:hypothetical protein NDU88_000413 [Pleurodeles waltl]
MCILVPRFQLILCTRAVADAVRRHPCGARVSGVLGMQLVCCILGVARGGTSGVAKGHVGLTAANRCSGSAVSSSVSGHWDVSQRVSGPLVAATGFIGYVRTADNVASEDSFLVLPRVDGAAGGGEWAVGTVSVYRGFS